MQSEPRCLLPKRNLLPKHHLLYEAGTQPLQCSICYERAVGFMQCAGPCQQIFCLHCISNIKRRGISCPSRCSKSFLIKPLPSRRIQFQCPFNPHKCTPLPTLKQFKAHSCLCPEMDSCDLQQLKQRQEYLCRQGHELVFLKYCNFATHIKATEYDFYDFIQLQYCSSCHEMRLSRAICKQCTQQPEFYCMECRPLPINRFECAFGHHFQQTQNQNYEFDTLCDLCGHSTILSDKLYYTDSECDLDICKACFDCCGSKIGRRMTESHPEPVEEMKEEKSAKVEEGEEEEESSEELDYHGFFMI